MDAGPRVSSESSDALTPLRRQLLDGRPPTALDAFRIARRAFQAGAPIEMGAIADALSINRVTLYRWVGTREQLLVEVIFSVTEPALERAYERAEGSGGIRIANALTGFIEDTLGHPGIRRLLAEQGEGAMRLLTSTRSGYQSRFIAAVEAMLRREAEAGQLDVPVDLHDLAYVIVRLVESYVYTEYITGEKPEPERARPVLQLLLGGRERAR
jgi:AcrR family transcriptional regulator